MFELNISCSKDFNELHIVFADGTSVVSTKPCTNEKPREKRPETRNKNPHSTANSNKKEEFLDLDVDFDHVSQEVIEKPVIADRPREVKVASELQNLDI